MPFFFYDPTFIILIPGFLLALYAQWRVQSTFNYYSGIRASNGYTGAQMAAELLRRQGITDVTIEQVGGRLADHYDPRTKKLRLSPDVYASDSLAAVGVAAHETGHALQHRDGYAPLALRSAIVPAATLGTNAAALTYVAAAAVAILNLLRLLVIRQSRRD